MQEKKNKKVQYRTILLVLHVLHDVVDKIGKEKEKKFVDNQPYVFSVRENPAAKQHVDNKNCLWRQRKRGSLCRWFSVDDKRGLDSPPDSSLLDLFPSIHSESTSVLFVTYGSARNGENNTSDYYAVTILFNERRW